MRFKNTLPFFLFSSIALALAFLCYFGDIFFLRPQGIHQWRQCDGAAYAYNYYKDGLSFFFPATMNLAGYKGHVISELPIIYYLAAKCYQWFGFSEGWLRLISHLFFLSGVYYFFKLSLRELRSPWLASLSAVFVLSSPVVIYYAYNFLPNTPAFGLMLGAWYFFMLFFEERQARQFALASAFITLACLLKPVEIFNYLTMLAVLGWAYLWAWIKKDYSKAMPIKPVFISIVFVFGLNFLWYKYVQGYNDIFGNHANLQGILPIWDMNWQDIRYTWKIIFTQWAPQFIWLPLAALLGLGLITLGIFHRRLPRHYFQILFLTTFFQIAYLLLFYQTFMIHDYYLINVMIVPIWLFLMILKLISSFEWKAKSMRIALPLVSVVLCLLLAGHCRHIMYERYFGSLHADINPALHQLTPYLRELGIKDSDLVVSVPDLSPNVSLYLLQQKGWSEAYTFDGGYNIHYFKDLGAQYLIVHQDITQHPEWYAPYMQQLLGERDGVKVYKIQ